jgi:hypothetical protein
LVNYYQKDRTDKIPNNKNNKYVGMVDEAHLG